MKGHGNSEAFSSIIEQQHVLFLITASSWKSKLQACYISSIHGLSFPFSCYKVCRSRYVIPWLSFNLHFLSTISPLGPDWPVITGCHITRRLTHLRLICCTNKVRNESISGLLQLYCEISFWELHKIFYGKHEVINFKWGDRLSRHFKEIE